MTMIQSSNHVLNNFKVTKNSINQGKNASRKGSGLESIYPFKLKKLLKPVMKNSTAIKSCLGESLGTVFLSEVGILSLSLLLVSEANTVQGLSWRD